jgi:hypothetical protein
MNVLLHSYVTHKRDISYSLKFFHISHFSSAGAIFCPKYSHMNGLLVSNYKTLQSEAIYITHVSCTQEYVNVGRGNQIASRGHQPCRNLIKEIQRGRDILVQSAKSCGIIEHRSVQSNGSRSCFSA